MSRRQEKTSSEQKDMLVSFMLEHLDFAQGKLLGVEGRVNHNKLWEEVTQLLNRLDGATKNNVKWQISAEKAVENFSYLSANLNEHV